MKTPSASHATWQRVLRLLLRGLLVLWAGFWAWFVVMASVGEPPAPPWWIPAAWLASLALLVALCWKRPTLGGLVLLAAGILAAVVFDDPGARALLAAPAVALGAGCVVQGWSARRVASAALLLLAGLTLGACLAPQDSADLPFRTSSIRRHDNGRMERAFLVEETEIEGFPCRRWIRWYESGQLESVELARALEVQGHAFPEHTRLFFDPEGRLAHAWLSRDAEIDGLPCRGRLKIDTAFHPNGHVRAFFPPDTFEIDGVRCVASVFHPVYLHPDGGLQRCKLAGDVTLAGRTFRKGTTLELDEAGRARL